MTTLGHRQCPICGRGLSRYRRSDCEYDRTQCRVTAWRRRIAEVKRQEASAAERAARSARIMAAVDNFEAETGRMPTKAEYAIIVGVVA